MPDSGSEDQLDAGVLSGEQASCSAALTSGKYITEGVVVVGVVVSLPVPTLQNVIAHLGRPYHISPAWHLQRRQEGGWGSGQKKNTLQEDYAARVPSLFQEFVIVN